MTEVKERASFGNVRQLPSGRFQARWRSAGKYHSARQPNGSALTFTTKRKARDWLNRNAEAIRAGTWSATPPPEEAPPEARTFETAAEEWLSRRTLSPRTEHGYRDSLRLHLLPTFGSQEVTAITRAEVDDWWHGITGKDTARRHAYDLMRWVFAREVDLGHALTSPCRLDKRDRAAQTPGTGKHETKVLDDRVQLDRLVAAMPERHRLMVELTTLCALRFGEVTELRRGDLDLDASEVHVRRAVARVGGQQPHVKTPKSHAGARTLPIPARLIDALRTHLAEYAEPGADGLLFPATGGGHLAPSAFYGRAPKAATKTAKAKPGSGFYGARAAIGRPDLHFHDLRHTGLTWLGHSGATPQTLALYAGHAGLAMVARYSMHEIPGQLRAAQEAMLAR